MDETNKKSAIPLRERIVRKAKEKATLTLHELTINPRSNNQTSDVTKSPSVKRNNRSYKPFPELNNQQQSDDELSETNEYESPKKQIKVRRKGVSKESKSIFKQHRAVIPQATGNAADFIEDASTSFLFTQIYQGQTALQALVDDWIESYKRDPNLAMLDLMRLIIRSSGCRVPLPNLDRDLLKSKEFSDCINEIVEAFSNDDDTSEQYPLVQGSLQARRFRSNLSDFIQLLVNQCQYSIVYDQFMLDVFITFLIALADSQVRAFRHTATLVVLKIMTALVDVLLSLSISKDANQRQYDNERSKTAGKRATDRLEMLTNKRKELEENEYEIQNLINFIFKAVFIHRYRDVCADIRSICINEIGEWMRKCAEKFLDDTFLKYIGWTLYDRVAECRLKCLQALHPLYEDDGLLSRLELFTSRFKNRIVEMTIDKDIDVCVSAIKLLTKIVTQNDAALEDKDCENVYELVYHSNRQIAQAAGGFLNQKLFSKAENTDIEFRRNNNKNHSENSTFLQLLVQFLIESELHDHPTHLVDAMWDIHEMLKDWQCMSDLLLEDPLNPEEGLDDLHERYLIEIIYCCVKQAATGEYPVSRRTQINRKLTAKEAKQVEIDKIELTKHFIQTLPNLMIKYIADSDKLVHLIKIAQFFDLNQYTLCRQEKFLDKFLKVIEEILSKHNEASLLEECSKVLCYFCDEETPIYSKCNIARSSILDDLVDKFTASMHAFDKLTEVDENEMYPLQIALKRLAIFAENHDITRYDLVQNTFTILKWAVYNEGFGHELVDKALTLARSIISWNMYKLDQELVLVGLDDDDDEDHKTKNQSVKELVEYISKLSKKFYKLCNKLFVNDNPAIEQEAYFELCDLLILFSINLVNTNKEYKPLLLECSTNDINMLSVYVMNNVFNQEAANEKAETAENIEKLHRRRCILSSFCKLISYNCVPIKYAAEVFRGYVKYSSSYGDIIKTLLSNCREINKVNTAKTIALALQREYNEAVLNNNNNSTNCGTINRLDRNSVEFSSLKELAHKFCLSFGPEASMKSREAIVAIHNEAIYYAYDSTENKTKAPLNLPFLEVITEFSSRLTSQDKKSILNELDKRFAKRANKIEENNWTPYYVYRLTLMEDVSNGVVVAGTTSSVIAPKTINDAAPCSPVCRVSTSTTVTTTMPNSILRRPPIANSTTLNIAATSENLKNKETTQLELSGIQNHKNNLSKKNIYNEEDDENMEEQNLNAESTINDLGSLKISNTNHSDNNGRLTRTSKQLSNKGLESKSSPTTKRPRSPLVSTNNSINDSTSIVERDINRFESTRNDGAPKQSAAQSGPRSMMKMSIPLTPLQKTSVTVVDEGTINNDEESNIGPLNKRKRKSTLQNEENSKEKSALKALSVN